MKDMVVSRWGRSCETAILFIWFIWLYGQANQVSRVLHRRPVEALKRIFCLLLTDEASNTTSLIFPLRGHIANRGFPEWERKCEKGNASSLQRLAILSL